MHRAASMGLSRVSRAQAPGPPAGLGQGRPVSVATGGLTAATGKRASEPAAAAAAAAQVDGCMLCCSWAPSVAQHRASWKHANPGQSVQLDWRAPVFGTRGSLSQRVRFLCLIPDLHASCGPLQPRPSGPTTHALLALGIAAWEGPSLTHPSTWWWWESKRRRRWTTGPHGLAARC